MLRGPQSEHHPNLYYVRSVNRSSTTFAPFEQFTRRECAPLMRGYKHVSARKGPAWKEHLPTSRWHLGATKVEILRIQGRAKDETPRLRVTIKVRSSSSDGDTGYGRNHSQGEGDEKIRRQKISQASGHFTTWIHIRNILSYIICRPYVYVCRAIIGPRPATHFSREIR